MGRGVSCVCACVCVCVCMCTFMWSMILCGQPLVFVYLSFFVSPSVPLFCFLSSHCPSLFNFPPISFSHPSLSLSLSLSLFLSLSLAVIWCYRKLLSLWTCSFSVPPLSNPQLVWESKVPEKKEWRYADIIKITKITVYCINR